MTFIALFVAVTYMIGTCLLSVAMDKLIEAKQSTEGGSRSTGKQQERIVVLKTQRIPKSEKPILAGLYLSKFDSLGLKRLGFGSFTEAFNVLGYTVGSPPGSIKNYRDEFDPCSRIHERAGINVPDATTVSRCWRSTKTSTSIYFRD